MSSRIIRDQCRRSRTLDALSDFAERSWWRVITLCDDYGCFEADFELLIADLYPLKARSMKSPQIAAVCREWQEVGLVRFYVSEEKIYGECVTWAKHQRVRESKRRCPDPTLSEEIDITTIETNDFPQVAASRGKSRQVAARAHVHVRAAAHAQQSESESESESERKRERKKTISEKSALPEKPGISVEVQLFEAVTKRRAYIQNYPRIVEVLKGKTYGDVFPYYEEWLARDYKAGNMNWLDWVKAGVIPPQYGRASPTEPTNATAIIQSMLSECEDTNGDREGNFGMPGPPHG